VKNIQQLRDFIERDALDNSVGTDRASSSAEQFDVLTQTPILGDRKFKLEIGMARSRLTVYNLIAS
jgi:hypothetical protein